MQNHATTGRPLEFDPEKTREVLMRLFWEKGFGAVSLPEMEARTGLSRSSLYNSFGSKQAIFRQALERYRRLVGAELCRPLEGGARGLDDVLDFVDAAASCFADRAGSAGCLLVNSMMEFGGEDEAVSAHSGEHLVRLRHALEATLDRAVALGEIPRATHDAKVDLLLGLLLGISVAARAGLSRGEIQALVDAARVQVEAWARPVPRHH